MHVTIWNEYVHERSDEAVRKVYPDGIHAVLAAAVGEQLGAEVTVRTATLDQPEHGLGQAVLDETDVLLWWGHAAHDEVDDEVVARVQQRVWQGMGLLVLHSGHGSKIFQRLMGTGCMLRWREAGERERLWIVDPSHEIVDGLDAAYFDLPQAEMYGEFFDIPQPDELVLISWFEGGEVFRSGCTFRRGKGKIFYFRPGHETYPIYYDPNIRKILGNAIRWARPSGSPYQIDAQHCP
ncbi:ThuA domain-containing protein [Roseimaritima sediminicola]|uniref:ThuA domain-containing protein n=1 Tax=Roseimaritima sediminicola TaxID=2662066 RepID=UPI0012982D14|nr:ThuA domain-containing protein [Roseimaritima sediminicola]